MSALEDAAKTLPEGIAIVHRTVHANSGKVEETYVLLSRSPDSGRLSRRVGVITNLSMGWFTPFNDAPYWAIAALEGAQWVIDERQEVDDASVG